MKKQKLVSVKKYAALCGVKPITIYKRIERGLLIPFLDKGVTVINIDIDPPKKLKRGRPCYIGR
jgi:hypothetical protein